MRPQFSADEGIDASDWPGQSTTERLFLSLALQQTHKQQQSLNKVFFYQQWITDAERVCTHLEENRRGEGVVFRCWSHPSPGAVHHFIDGQHLHGEDL